MAQLTFWGLQQYDHVTAARTARKVGDSDSRRGSSSGQSPPAAMYTLTSSGGLWLCKALCAQMNDMMLQQWRQHAYICENYHPAKGHDGCSPGAMQFYHWGALSGFISLVDEGYY